MKPMSIKCNSIVIYIPYGEYKNVQHTLVFMFINLHCSWCESSVISKGAHFIYILWCSCATVEINSQIFKNLTSMTYLGKQFSTLRQEDGTRRTLPQYARPMSMDDSPPWQSMTVHTISKPSSSTPVSYTHLDVYKRQELILCKYIVLTVFDVTGLSSHITA